MDFYCINTRNHSKYFLWIVSSDSHNNPTRWIFIISSLEQMENLRSREIKSLDKVTQLEYHRVRAGNPDCLPSPLSWGPWPQRRQRPCYPTWEEASWLSLHENEAGSDVGMHACTLYVFVCVVWICIILTWYLCAWVLWTSSLLGKIWKEGGRTQQP